MIRSLVTLDTALVLYKEIVKQGETKQKNNFTQDQKKYGLLVYTQPVNAPQTIELSFNTTRVLQCFARTSVPGKFFKTMNIFVPN